LVGQYLALRHQYQYDQGSTSRSSNYIGMICLDCSPRDVVRQAVDLSRRLCRKRYGGRAPLVQMSGRLDLTFPYIPTYLQYVLLELLKNSLRAVSERHGQGALPPVQVVIADGNDQEDVVIKIGDEGGGIARSQVGKIWSYLYTTADPNVQRQFIGSDGIGATAGTAKDHDVQDASPIAGLGYGLPISRSYCRYFGGDLSLESMHGYGTDVFIHLKRLGDAHEPSLDLPQRSWNS
jgi:pyruvate dehydrogenase kinase 2/3/4